MTIENQAARHQIAFALLLGGIFVSLLVVVAIAHGSYQNGYAAGMNRGRELERVRVFYEALQP